MKNRNIKRISKRHREAMWSSGIRHVVKIIQETYQVDPVISDPVQYVEEFKPGFRAAGPTLKFLQLAKPDLKSPFDWSPTPRLKKLIAERKTAKNGKPLYKADILCQLLGDCVFGYKAHKGKGGVFAWEILLATGLLHRDALDDWVTEDLHYLFCNGYFAKRCEDGLPMFDI